MPDIYVPSVGPRDARLMVVGEAPGKDEEEQGKPFIGQSGKILRESLVRNGILPQSCFITNVCKYRPPNNDIKQYIKFTSKGVKANEYVTQGLQELYEDINNLRPDIIVPLGNVALWATAGKQQISKRRGSVLVFNPPSVAGWYYDNITSRVIPTIHPAAILRQYTLRTVFEFDVKKIARALKDPASVAPIQRKFYFAAEELENLVLQEDHYYIDESETYHLAQKLLNYPEYAVDIETPGGSLYCVGFSPDPSWSLVIRTDTSWKLRLIEQLLTNDKPKIFQNGLFDCSFLKQFEGIKVRNYSFDTMYAQHAIYPESSGGAVDEWKKKKNNPGMRLGLDFLTSIYTNEPYFKDEGKNQDLSIAESVEDYLSYNAKDVSVDIEIAQAQRENGLKENETAFQTTMSQMPVIIDMMTHGIKLDTKLMNSAREFYEAEKIKLQRELDEAALKKLYSLVKDADAERQAELVEAITIYAAKMHTGLPAIEVGSSKQMIDFLYNLCGYPEKKKKNPQGKLSVTTDEESIKELYGDFRDPLLLTIIDIRRADKLLDNYLSVKVDSNGYTYFSVNPVGTKTSRHSVSKTIHGYGYNITTTPRPNKARIARGHPNLRELVIAEDGHLLGYFDLSQVEDRIVSYLAGVQRKVHAFENDIDAHTLTASLIFGKPMEEIDKKGVERYLGKQSNHAFNYGEGPVTFTKKINKNADETGIWVNKQLSTGIRNGHLTAYPEIKDYWRYVETTIRKTRVLINPFGRRRRFFDRLNDSTFRDGYSWIPQSTAPDIINRGMVEVYHALRSHGVRILLQVHDAILVQLPMDGAEELAAEILKLMTVPVIIKPINDNYPKEIIVPVDYKLGPNWGDIG
jgi:uracil-DNA glycosylase family 4